MSSAGHDIQGTPPLWLNLRERRCTLEGDLVRTFGGAEEDKGHFVLGPLGLVLANGILYAPDAQPRYSPPRGRILMFAIDGAFLGYLPEPFGDHLSYFGTAITEHNGWIVAIRGTDVPSVVLKSPLDATFAYQWTAPGTDPSLGHLNSPTGLAIAADGLWYVTELYNHRVQVLRPSVELE